MTDFTHDNMNRLTDIDEYRKDPNVGLGSPDPDFTDNPKLAEYTYILRADGKRNSADEKIYADNGVSGRLKPARKGRFKTSHYES